jgi:hypothetical protein
MKVGCVLLFAITSFLCLSCSKRDPIEERNKAIKAHANYHVSQFILDKFKDHQVTMLSNTHRGEGIYYRRLNSFLNDWVDVAKDGKTNLKNLALVFDTDSVHVKLIKKYMSSHDFRDLTDVKPFYYPTTTTASLESYWRLGDILNKIDQLNKNGSEIKLNILGVEQAINLDDWSYAKYDLFSATVRDSLSANAIIDYLKANPEFRVLVFFEPNHMAIVESNMYKHHNKGPRYFMGHYLKETFGDQLYRFWQYKLTDFAGYTGVHFEPESSYVVSQKHIDKVDYGDPSPKDADIVNIGYDEPTVSLQFVKSKNLGYLALDEIKSLYPLNNDFYTHMGSQASEYLSMLTGDLDYIKQGSDSTKIMKYAPAWEKWLNDPKTDVVKEILSEAYGKRLIELMKAAPDKYIESKCEYLYLLTTGRNSTYDLRSTSDWEKGFVTAYDSETVDDRTDRFDFYELCLNKYSNKIIVTDLVQLLWVGTEQEKQEAIKELKDRTGQSFMTAPEWMQWWRENYSNL